MSEGNQALPNGLLVVFDGIDGVGKTTQLHLAENDLKAKGWPVYPTRNLGGTPIGEALRGALLTPLERPAKTDLYVAMAIQAALTEAITAERATGQLILMDRSPLSIAAYQVYGSGVDEATGWQYVEAGLEQLKPELIIIYDLDPKIALERVSAQAHKADYFESKPLDYFERVADGYREAGRRFGAQLIDANQSVDAIHAQTIAAIEQALQQKLQ